MNAPRLSSDHFFEELSELYRRDPEHFERIRKRLIAEAIESFPEEVRARARGLQFTLDAQLGRCKDPLQRMNLMVELFWDQFARFREVILDPASALQEKDQPPAKVIPLRRTLH